jgi:hypothetical protein
MDNYSLSVAQIDLFGQQQGSWVQCGLGTAFFFKAGEAIKLITNWHVVTGVDPTTMQPVPPGRSTAALSNVVNEFSTLHGLTFDTEQQFGGLYHLLDHRPGIECAAPARAPLGWKMMLQAGFR